MSTPRTNSEESSRANQKIRPNPKSAAQGFLSVILAVQCTAISHRYWEFAEPARRLQEGQFYKNLAIIGGALFLFICAAGRFSLDATLMKKR